MLDYGTGAQAAFAIAAALTRRERTGKGQRLDVAMLDAAIVLMGSNVVQTNAEGKSARPAREQQPGKSCVWLSRHRRWPIDDRAHTTRQHVRFWQVLGRQDIAGELETLAPQQICARVDHDAPLMREILATRSAAEWEQCLNEAGVPAARVRTVDEAIASGQLDGRAVLQDSGVFSAPGEPLKNPGRGVYYQRRWPDPQNPAATLW